MEIQRSSGTVTSDSRYRINSPIPGGYQYWDVIDTESEVMPNFPVASLSVHMPGAAQEADRIWKKLSGAVG